MSLNYNSKQRNKVIQGLRSFKNTLPTNVKKVLIKKGKIYSETLDNWKNIVGKDLFKVCYPKSFKNSNKLNESCLNIMVKRGNEVDLEYSKNTIIKKINAYFGYNVVQNIKLNTFEDQYKETIEKKNINVTKKKHIKQIANIKNDVIKNSLLELNKFFKAK